MKPRRQRRGDRAYVYTMMRGEAPAWVGRALLWFLAVIVLGGVIRWIITLVL
jgi:hypothetical protein